MDSRQQTATKADSRQQIKDKQRQRQIAVADLKPTDCKDWLLNKHYAKKIPPINYAYGLVIDDYIQGICTFGIPASGFKFSMQPLELNRLVINADIGENVLSQFVSKVLKLLPKPAIIVSYADTNQGHHGYIYQATNWIYTGTSSAEKIYYVNNSKIHRRSLYDKFGTSSESKLIEMGLDVKSVEQVGKHRYFYIIGNKKQKAKLLAELKNKYKILPYPKGDNTNYDASYTPKHKYNSILKYC